MAATQVISDQGAHKFVAEGLTLATQLFGDPVLPVGQVTLAQDGGLYTERRMEQACPSVIHIRLGPSDFSFYFELAQEIPHLLNTRLRDVYVEGLNLIFAKKLFAQTKRCWESFEQHLNQQPSVYSDSYRMMTELWHVVGDQNIRALLRHVRPQSSDTRWMEIDVAGWLKSLDKDLAQKAKKVILRHYDALSSRLCTTRGMADYSLNHPCAGDVGAI